MHRGCCYQGAQVNLPVGEPHWGLIPDRSIWPVDDEHTVCITDAEGDVWLRVDLGGAREHRDEFIAALKKLLDENS